MDIAILHYSCPPVVGGVEEIVRQQASLFHRYQHAVKIIAGKGSQFTEDYAIEINPLLSSRNIEILNLQKNPVENYKQIKDVAHKIYQYLESSLSNFDILIAHNVLTMNYNLPLTIALHEVATNNIIKLVSWNHDSPYFYKDWTDPHELHRSERCN